MEAIESFISIFKEVEDPRFDRQKKHLLIDILVITLVAVVCGAESWTGIEAVGKAKEPWFKRFLELPNGIPSHDTFSRVLSILEPSSLSSCFSQWVSQALPHLSESLIAIDGKTLRTSSQYAKTPLHMITAYASEAGLVLGQMESEGKKNEIKSLPKLIDKLSIEKNIVTIDAMGCQKEIVAKIHSKKGEYVIALKGNQKTLHESVKSHLDAILLGKLPHYSQERFETVSKGHGRLEKRLYLQTDDVDWVEEKADWAGLKSIGMVESSRTIGEKISTERRYFLSSLELNAERFSEAVRTHWHIENCVHWVLDVVFNEDRARQYIKNCAQNMSFIRRLSLNLLKRHPSKHSLKTKKLIANMDLQLLEEVIFGSTN